jgi:DnaJ homolog subfamily C member 13
MLRAQCILFRRYGTVLAPFKYAGYPQLLEALRQQAGSVAGVGSTSTGAQAAGTASSAGSVSTTSGTGSGSSTHFLSADVVGQVLAAVELCWLTCVASRRNAEELLRSGGLPLLCGLLTR